LRRKRGIIHQFANKVASRQHEAPGHHTSFHLATTRWVRSSAQVVAWARFEQLPRFTEDGTPPPYRVRAGHQASSAHGTSVLSMIDVLQRGNPGASSRRPCY